MPISAKRMAILREHVRAESVHDMDELIVGMTADCFNDVVGAPEGMRCPAPAFPLSISTTLVAAASPRCAP